MHPPTVDQYASYQLAQLQIENSGLIQGFLTKCAEAAYSPKQTLDALYDAARVSPHIAAEFAACGLQKRAFGSPGMVAGMAEAAKLPNTNWPPDPPKLPSTYKPGPSSPSPSILGSAWSGFKQGIPKAPARWYDTMKHITAGGVAATHGAMEYGAGVVGKKLAPAAGYFGKSPDQIQTYTDGWNELQNQGATNVNAGLKDLSHVANPDNFAATSPTSNPLATVARGNQQQAWQRQMGFNIAAGAHGMANGIVREVPPLIVGGKFLRAAGGALKSIPGVTGAVSKVAPYIGYGSSAAYAGDLAQPIVNGIAGTNPNGTAKLPVSLGAVADHVGAAFGSQDPQLDAPTAAGPDQQAVAPPVPPPQAQNSAPSRGAFITQGTTSAPPTAVPAAPQPPAAQPPMGPATPPPPAAVSTQPQAAPGTQPPEKPPSVIEQDPGFEAVSGLVQQDPEQATALGEKAMKQVSGAVTTAAGATELEALKKSGKLTPQGQQQATDALAGEGRYDWGQAAETVKNMDGWEQLGLWGGIGMAGLGLLHALSGGGGVGSLLMGALGLGAAGFTLGQAGLFGQQGKDITAGLTDAAGSMFGQQSPEAAPAGTAPPTGEQPGMMASAVEIMQNPAAAIPKAVASLPEQPNTATRTILRTLAAADPAKAKRMDDAVRFKWFGSEKQVAEELKIPPHDAAKLMRHWEDFRAANPPAN